MTDGVDLSVPPSGTGCVECEAAGGWWVHLRRCAQCGHIGCCDSSPGQHSSAHHGTSGHPVMQSFEPGEDWFWNFVAGTNADVPEDLELAPPSSHPDGQTVPGPVDRLPADWRDHVRG